MSYYQEAWLLMMPFLKRLMSKPGTIGVAVLCSAGLPEAVSEFDEHSDFDVSVLISLPGWRADTDWRPAPGDAYRNLRGRLPGWLPNFDFRIPAPWGELVVNVNQLVLEYELDERTLWDHDKADAYGQKTTIFADSHDAFAGLIAQKTSRLRTTFPARIRYLANRLTWDTRRVPEIGALRGGSAVGNYLVNNAIEQYIELIYLLHGRFIAARKWRLSTLHKFGLLPADDYDMLLSLLNVKADSAEDLQRRTILVAELWRRLAARFALANDQQLRVEYLRSDVQLLDQTAADRLTPGYRDDSPLYHRANYELWDCADPTWHLPDGTGQRTQPT